MSYVRDTLQFMSDGQVLTRIAIAEGVGITKGQVRDVLAQLMTTGRCECVGREGPHRVSSYAITPFGIECLKEGLFRNPTPVKKKEKPMTIGIVPHAMKTQPVSVWGLAA